MTLFWLSTVALSVLACVMIALPLIKRKENNDDILRDETEQGVLQRPFV